MIKRGRFWLLILLTAIFSSLSWPGPVKIGALVSYYQVADPVFKDIYGRGKLQYGISLSYDLERDLHPIAKRSEMYLEADYFADQGTMSMSKEKVSLSIVSILFGARVRIIDSGRFKPYLGLGAGACFLKENVPSRLEDVSETARELHAEAGIYMAITKRILMDLNIRYALADAGPFGETVKLGGIRAGLGIGFRL